MWVTPTAEISIITDRKLRRAANLVSDDHTTFTLEVIARLKDFAGEGGRYSDQAAAVITALTELDRTHRVVELERKAQEHVNAARAAQILQTITEKENPNAKLRTRGVRRH